MHRPFRTHCMSLSFELGCFHLQHSGIADVLRVRSRSSMIFHNQGTDSVAGPMIFHSFRT